MIKIDNVSYTYSKGGGVSNINLTIDDGEFVFLIGPTGSGKTTILRLLYLDLFPKAGKVIIDKFDSQTIKKRKIPYLRRRVGVIFQNYHLLEDRNLFENIALPLHVLGYDKDEILELVNESIDEIGLKGKETHYPNELSGGEQQRACIARALIKDPDIIINLLCLAVLLLLDLNSRWHVYNGLSFICSVITIIIQDGHELKQHKVVMFSLIFFLILMICKIMIQYYLYEFEFDVILYEFNEYSNLKLGSLKITVYFMLFFCVLQALITASKDTG